VSSESRFDSDAGASEPHTDPTLRAITDQELPPLWDPRVPELDDRTLAQLLAELDGDDEPTRYRRRRATPAADAAGGSSTPRAAPPPTAYTPPPSAEATQETPIVPAQPRGQGHASPTPRHPSPQRFGPPPSAPRRPDHPHLELSAAGPVIHSSFGDFRPPVKPVRDEQGLTGLTRRSRTRLGSLVFTLVFVAIFLVIVIETLVSLLSAGVSP
jgi:hypothetical protein